MPVRKPLLKSEVPQPWIPYIEWEGQGKQQNKYGIYTIAVQCPVCGEARFITECGLRSRANRKSLKCCFCANRRALEPREVSEEWRGCIVWEGNREQLHGGWNY